MPNYYPWSCAICWTTYTLVRIVLVDLELRGWSYSAFSKLCWQLNYWYMRWVTSGCDVGVTCGMLNGQTKKHMLWGICQWHALIHQRYNCTLH